MNNNKTINQAQLIEKSLKANLRERWSDKDCKVKIILKDNKISQIIVNLEGINKQDLTVQIFTWYRHQDSEYKGIKTELFLNSLSENYKNQEKSFII